MAGRQRSFVFSAAAELVAFALANAPQTASPCRFCRFAPPAFPKILKLLWLKPPFARKPQRASFRNMIADMYFSKNPKILVREYYD